MGCVVLWPAQYASFLGSYFPMLNSTACSVGAAAGNVEPLDAAGVCVCV
jgi:hypothetical protein